VQGWGILIETAKKKAGECNKKGRAGVIEDVLIQKTKQ
jgi:hypothetical protein